MSLKLDGKKLSLEIEERLKTIFKLIKELQKEILVWL